ncbi:MAG: helix-turn-helix domain-containing protein [Steroidobacteraceae bacterium]
MDRNGLPPLVSLPEAMRMLSLGRTSIYALLGRKLLRARKFGRLLRIETDSILELIGDSPRAQIALSARERRKQPAQTGR